MANRRITEEGHHALKQIAGLLQKLSYRDMQRLTQCIWDACPEQYAEFTPETLATIILCTADDILETTEKDFA